MSRELEIGAAPFLGGRVCFDFANTVYWRTSAEPQESIPDLSAFVAWCVSRGILSPPMAARYAEVARADPNGSADTMQDVLKLRRELWTVFDALQGGQRRVDLGVVNDLLSRAPSQPHVLYHEGLYMHGLPGRAPGELLWPILWSLTAVLTSADAARVGCCHGEGCGWYYVDESPNRTRIWCSSAICGNRERVRRAYLKRRSAPKAKAKEA